MTQAEIAYGGFTPPYEKPSKGRCLRDCVLASRADHPIKLFDYLGPNNLVLILTAGQPQSTLLADLEKLSQKINEEEAKLLVISLPTESQPGGEERSGTASSSFLVDTSGEIHLQLGATDDQGRPAAAVYITDRFGEVFGLYRTSDGQQLPGATDILSWLTFINNQCPECEAPEWPL